MIPLPPSGLPPLGPSLATLRHHKDSLPATAMARRVEPRFEDISLNNSLVIATIGKTVSLPCKVFMKQVFCLVLFTYCDLLSEACPYFATLILSIIVSNKSTNLKAVEVNKKQNLNTTYI